MSEVPLYKALQVVGAVWRGGGARCFSRVGRQEGQPLRVKNHLAVFFTKKTESSGQTSAFRGWVESSSSGVGGN